MLHAEIFGSDSRSPDCSADQATTGDVDPPARVTEASSHVRITVTETEKRRSEVCLPGGAENGDADSDGDADGREGIGRDGHECPAPRTRMCHHRRRNSDRVANGRNENV